MGYEDHAPSGGGYRNPIDPRKLKKIKERWAQAESIRQISTQHHQAQEVPAAESQLEKDLEEMNSDKGIRSKN